MNRAQKGDMAPMGEVTVTKGQRSKRVIVSAAVKLAVGPRSLFKRAVIDGRKVARKVSWALPPIEL